MVRLWLSRGTSIPIREQLSAQLILGVLSGRLAPGERLPSVRELARRLNVHANTISATYQDLAKRGWVSRRRGSGVFVHDLRMPEDERSLEMFVRGCVEDGLARGFSLDALQSAFGRLAQNSPMQRFLVVDPDPHMARILAAEIGEATARILPFAGCGEASQLLTADTCVLASAAQAPKVRELLGHVSLRTIQLKSMQDVLTGHQRPASAVLIAVVSRSESILHWASTLLSALGFPADSVLERNPQVVHWQDGLAACDIVATDVVTASELPKGARPTVFRVVSDEFLAEFRALVTA
ncbi:MAG TPA: GntR family transcriptional regulator [Bryobacteraceae bacterium]|jgi:DNA-binding transcriptional regulator YhcF (GntR family)|nr:GntR family transcriptional regulator [Bryobacteraceae bacterium]